MTVAAADWIGLTLSGGRYRITGKLGEGGMGLVYRAWDENVGHDVVVKVPRRSMMDDPGFAARFKDEIRSLIKLPHPHIVKVFDVGEHEGLPFAVMQFLPGGSLEDRAYDRDGSARPMPPSSLAGWLPQVSKALQFMHGEKYVHRDVKPANILFDTQGNAYLSDFGVHKALAGGETQAKVRTGTGMVLGTPHYMAPELAQGESVDGRIDQYALAVTVHEVLCGQKPFDGPTGLAIMFAHVNQPPPRLDAVAPGVPHAVAEAVLRGLEKDSANRFKTCTAFAAAVLTGVGGTTAQPRIAPGAAQQPCAAGTAVLSPVPVSGAAGPSPVPQALRGTQQTLRPAVKTAAMAAAPAAQTGSVAPSSVSRSGRPKDALVAWLKSPLGVSACVAAGFLLVAVMLLSGARSDGRAAGGKKGVGRPTPKAEPTSDLAEEPPAYSKLSGMVSQWNRLATEFEAALPPSASDIVKRMEYANEAACRGLLDQADNDRDDLSADSRLDELRKLAAEIAREQSSLKDTAGKKNMELSRATAAVQDHLARIDSQLKTPIVGSPQAKAELEALGEFDRLQRSWQAVAVTQAARTRANEYVAQTSNRALQFLGACALLRDNSLSPAVRTEMLRNWEAAYSEQQRAEICLALIFSGIRDLVDEAMKRINNEPRLLGMYDPQDLFASIERNRKLWEPAREGLTSYFAGSNAERLATALGPPPAPSLAKTNVPDAQPIGGTKATGNVPPMKAPQRFGGKAKPSGVSPFGSKQGPAASASSWTSPISLPDGGNLKPDDTQLQGYQLDKIDRELPQHAFRYKNEKANNGSLLVHAGWSMDKKDGLSLDGWTIFRHENGAPKLAVEFDNDDRKGPLRYWDEDGKLRLYANYKADKLDGPACYFEDDRPAAIMNYDLGRLKDKYAVDYSSGAPLAKKVDGSAPDTAEKYASAEKRFEELKALVQQDERKLKTYLKDSYKKIQKDLIAKRSKYLRERNQAIERAKNRAYQEDVGRVLGALAVGTGAF